MASNEDHNDLAPEHTEGFKVGQKKTMDEYNKLGQWPIHLPAENLLSLLVTMLFRTG